MTEDVKNADANAPKKLSIQRRTKTTVSSTTAGGKAKAVQVEVRKKRTVPTDAARKAAEAEKLKAQQEAEKKAAEEKARLAAEKAAAEKAKAEKAKVEAEKAAKPAQSAVENKPKSVDPEKEKRKAEEAELRRKAEELARQKAEEQARKAAEDANPAGIDKVNYMAMGILAVLFALIVLAGLLSGQAIGETLTKVLTAQVWAGLTAAGKMMPALGFAMLLKVMLSKEYAIFMVLGFVLVAYGKLPLLAIAMVGIAAAVYDFHVSMKTKNNTGGGMTDGI